MPGHDRSMIPVAGVALSTGAVLLGSVARRSGVFPLVIAAALLLMNVALLRMTVGRFGSPSDTSRRVTTVLAAGWLAMAVLPVHNFSYRDPTQAISSLNAQSAIELLAYAAFAASGAYLLRAYVPLVGIGAPLTILPVWVAASASWGVAPIYAIGRGLQFGSMAVLALATAGLAVRSRGLLDDLVSRIVRWFPRLIVILVMAGVVLGPLFVVRGAANRDRFTWIGAHPTEAGLLLGVAVLILGSTSSDLLGVRPWMRVGAIAIVCAALFENQSRTPLGGLIVGGGIAIVLKARRKPGTAALSGALAIGTTVVGIIAAGGAIGSFLLRGRDFANLRTLNGRSQLWTVGFDALASPLDWLNGLGYGATRYVFVEDYEYAGNAHNSLLAMLVSLGLIGATLLVLGLVRGVSGLARSGFLRDSDHGPVVLGVAAYTVVYAVTSDLLAEPNFGSVWLYLITAIGSGWWASRSTEVAAAGSTETAEVAYARQRTIATPS